MSKNIKALLLVALLSSGLLLAMGNPPPQPSSVKKATTIESPAIEPTAEKQFARAYSEYADAQHSSSYYADRAVKSFEDYIKYYPKDEKRVDGLFLLSRSCLLNNEYDKQEKYLDQYLREAPTYNVYQKYASLDSATIMVKKNDYTKAKPIFAELLSQYGTDPAMKREIYKRSLPIYENENNKEKLMDIYSYYTVNRRYLENQNLYYVYCYKLGIMYLAKGDTQKAKSYFKIVEGEKSPQNKMLAESAKSYLAKLK